MVYHEHRARIWCQDYGLQITIIWCCMWHILSCHWSQLRHGKSDVGRLTLSLFDFLLRGETLLPLLHSANNCSSCHDSAEKGVNYRTSGPPHATIDGEWFLFAASLPLFVGWRRSTFTPSSDKSSVWSIKISKFHFPTQWVWFSYRMVLRVMRNFDQL